MSESELNLPPPDLLLHVCCGPCAVWPVKTILDLSPRTDLRLWFYNPNIQPLNEFRRRRDGLAFAVFQLTALMGPSFSGRLKADFSPPYEQEKFLAVAAVNPRPPERCAGCYELRLLAAARAAKDKGLLHFSTTLLFSRQQKHELIIRAGQKAAGITGVKFYYQNFRLGWSEGRAMAKEFGLYRQNYCGCVYGAEEQG
jgi:predicted adenine nucleotide alpha hydrolase (AANH) superfamily ATPase